MTTTDPQDTPDDALTARARRRSNIRWLLNLVSLTPAGHAELRTAIDAELADADEAHTRLADYENRITWETTCGEHARLLDSCRAADERAEQAETALAHLQQSSEAAGIVLARTADERDRAAEDARLAMEQRQQMAAERYALQQRADLADRVKRTAAKDAADALARAEKAEAAIIRVWDLADRWERALAADAPYARALRATLDWEQPIGPEPEAPCFHPSWETEPTLGARRCTDCGEWLDPQPPAPDGAALWATIKPHAAADTAFWARLTRTHTPNPRA